MSTEMGFQPNWFVPPGATISALLEERDISIESLAEIANKTLGDVSRLIYGVEPLTTEWAQALTECLGASQGFWLRREQQYRSDLERLCEEATSAGNAEWLSLIPLREAVSYGWIPEGRNAYETRLNACAFFGTTSDQGFERQYETLFDGARYKTSNAFKSNDSSLATWLRHGEVVARSISTAGWNPELLRSSQAEIRALTMIGNPVEFIPRLKAVLATCGVAFVVSRAPKGCRASGVARFLTPDSALIQLSSRYLADDQFWFTLFHEIGHLVLHAPSGVFIEDEERLDAKLEDEADDFAIGALLEEVGVSSLRTVELTKYSIARLARRAGIAPGIVVGELQRSKRVPYNHFNYLKTRYRWNDSELTL
ncbi:MULTISPECIES: ImmA/IrrE family metallo-endopeptidase [unclassified Pseudoxanthomonas]|uniref:ImmA/IrrE family metallo-endopeptidase n=1 Tax=unclassified Pseudoxanthomonas TaxID=2645906 RepID=UPI00307F2AC7